MKRSVKEKNRKTVELLNGQ